MEPEDIEDRLHRWQNARHVPNRHPVTVRRKGKNHVTVRIPFPITPPDTPPEASRTVELTCTLTPDDLYIFATLPRIVLGDLMSAYLAQATREIFRLVPKRETSGTLLKWKAIGEAQRIYPNIKWLIKHPQYQEDWFRDLSEAVKRSDNPSPTASDITAWVIERLHPYAWGQAPRLKKPTALANFAKDYLYTRRGERGRAYNPPELERLIRPLLP